MIFSAPPCIIVRVPRVPIVQSDHYHSYQITIQSPETGARLHTRGRTEEGVIANILRNSRQLCYPGAAQTQSPAQNKQHFIQFPCAHFIMSEALGGEGRADCGRMEGL